MPKYKTIEVENGLGGIKLSESLAKEFENNEEAIKTYADYIRDPASVVAEGVSFYSEDDEVNKKLRSVDTKPRMFGVAKVKNDSERGYDYELFYVGTIEEGKVDLADLDIIDEESDAKVLEYFTPVSRGIENYEELIEIKTKDELWKPYDKEVEIAKNGEETAYWKEKCREMFPERSILPFGQDNYETLINEFSRRVNATTNLDDAFDIPEWFEKRGYSTVGIDETTYSTEKLEATGIVAFEIPRDGVSLDCMMKDDNYVETEKDLKYETLKSIIPNFYDENGKLQSLDKKATLASLADNIKDHTEEEYKDYFYKESSPSVKAFMKGYDAVTEMVEEIIYSTPEWDNETEEINSALMSAKNDAQEYMYPEEMSEIANKYSVSIKKDYDEAYLEGMKLGRTIMQDYVIEIPTYNETNALKVSSKLNEIVEPTIKQKENEIKVKNITQASTIEPKGHKDGGGGMKM